MIKFLTGMTTDNVFLDRFADASVGVIVMIVVAFVVWHLWGERDDASPPRIRSTRGRSM